MQAKIPVLAVTDPNTDIGRVIVDGGFGWWCESNDLNAFSQMINKAVEYSFDPEVETNILKLEYGTEKAYKVIVNERKNFNY